MVKGQVNFSQKEQLNLTTSTWCENLIIKFFWGHTAQIKLMFLKSDVFVIQYTALHFCFVNFRTRRVIKYLRHFRFNVLSPREPLQRTKVKVVWLPFICHTAGRLRPKFDSQLVFSHQLHHIMVLCFTLMAVMSVQLIYSRSTNPPRRSLVHSQWRCEVSPSAPQKTHKEAGPVDWSFRKLK